MSMAGAIKSAMWARGLFEEIYGISAGEIPLGEDNVGAELNSQGPRKFATSRHFGIAINYVVEEVRGGNVTVHRTPTNMMLADFFTKPLDKITFNRLLNYMMIVKPRPCDQGSSEVSKAAQE